MFSVSLIWQLPAGRAVPLVLAVAAGQLIPVLGAWKQEPFANTEPSKSPIHRPQWRKEMQRCSFTSPRLHSLRGGLWFGTERSPGYPMHEAHQPSERETKWAMSRSSWAPARMWKCRRVTSRQAAPLGTRVSTQPLNGHNTSPQCLAFGQWA